MLKDFPAGSVLADLDCDAREELVWLGSRRQYGAGSVLMRQGEPPDVVYVLLDGYVKVTAITEEGELAFLAVRSRGDLVGEIGVLDGSARTATVTAAGAIVAQRVSGPAFRAYLAQYPPASAAVTRYVTRKFRSAIRRRLEYVSGSVRARLARLLLELADHWGEQTPEGTVIAVGLNQAELAALVGAVERSVNEALAELRTQGMVVVGYRRVVVKDTRKLNRVALGLG
ncbi:MULTISPECIES: Crp/Fnr family transcriptional regulator [unclassified Streptomyces]|uniref:Crp/Fnr family transcriptional regulator n=1 Tax=unclassified Streptomyces TaxID=2593676 RepID=UPI00365B8E11